DLVGGQQLVPADHQHGLREDTELGKHLAHPPPAPDVHLARLVPQDDLHRRGFFTIASAGGAPGGGAPEPRAVRRGGAPAAPRPGTAPAPSGHPAGGRTARTRRRGPGGGRPRSRPPPEAGGARAPTRSSRSRIAAWTSCRPIARPRLGPD